jgi:broad specificity phosphatase PhoE
MSVARHRLKRGLRQRWLAAALLLSQLLAAGCAAAQDAGLLTALQTPGHLGLMRHSTAPGSNDPPEFRLGDCATQRNLSQAGRDQAAAIGARLRTAGIDAVRLISSQWCRCLDTARLLDLGGVEELADLNSLVSYPGQTDEMTGRLREWILAQDLNRPTILVTHQINIGALLRAYPEEGEIAVVRRGADGRLEVLGTLGLD